ncbi:MAG: tetratricopeptide repeat protein, partial [Hyphomicrobium sp.]
WAQYYLRYHRALIADISSRRADARASYERVFKQDARTLRTALAYGRHAANSGDQKLARAVIKEHLEKTQGDGHPLARELRSMIETDANIPLLIKEPTEGLAEVFYGLGEALTGEGGVSIGVLYLQMALFLKPDHPFALAALANAHETTKRYEDANEVYDRIPQGSALQSAIDIRKAFNLNALDRTDEAKELLEKVAVAEPRDLKPLDALGNIMRSKKRYGEAADYYSRAIAMIDKPEKRHWTYYYARGTSFERLKKWPQAEVDLQRAMQLYPDQPLVLNYLGYSWVDQGRNLKLGMSLIEKAVSLKPDDGYIVDSLGWAHFRLGNYKDAVRYMERAVELRPEDPVLNDHLGDALWRVGREREARFQWEQSLSLEPEPEDASKIRQKLLKGLPPLSVARTTKKVREVARPAPQKKRETKLNPQSPFFE